ncbi:MAG TPA: sulfatase-like hydrolase/transferase, partial [Halioglobus sp.]
MNGIKLILMSMAVLLVYGCSHPINITGEGDVISASGSRNCSLQDFQAGSTKCSQNAVIGAYAETYTALPHPGWQFRRWASYCNAALDNKCSFNTPAATVQSYWGQTMPPLQAVFRSTTNTGFSALFMGQEFLQPFAAGIQAHAHAAGFGDHNTTVYVSPSGQGAPPALWNNTSQRAAIQATLNTGAIELLGMTYDPNFPDVNGYKNWVNYALAKNPDTRFFIATPWSTAPASLSSAQFAANHELAHAQVHGLIDALRAAYPGVDFYCLPSGQGAVELYNLYSAGNLPDVSALVGSGAEAVFGDSAGHPGDMLVALGQLVWLSAIYDIDLSDYSFDPGYVTDLKAIAGAIMGGHAVKYNAPAEVDVDTDSDGIWDRLDRNPLGRPNILLILADDLGYHDLAINNDNTEIDTPNMDQIARDGVRFTRHYAATVCSPARAALLTGIYPERLGYLPNGRGISPEVVTLPERLKEEGYSTWHIGKWHIGNLDRMAWPDHQGFDHWFGFLNQWRLQDVHSESGELLLSAPTYNDPWLESDSAPGKKYSGHLETILTDKAISVISDLDRAQAPWFLNLWYMAPHDPIQPAAEFAQNYPNTSAGKYQALVNQLDYNIGRVTSHLDAIGALQNTIIVIASDNGGTNLQVNNNAPFIGLKTELTEGGTRTPLII